MGRRDRGRTDALRGVVIAVHVIAAWLDRRCGLCHVARKIPIHRSLPGLWTVPYPTSAITPHEARPNSRIPDAIREQKRRDWAGLRESRVEFGNVRVRLVAPDRAEVSFTKPWVLAGARRWTGELRGTTEVRRTNGARRIFSERDRQVLWQRRS